MSSSIVYLHKPHSASLILQSSAHSYKAPHNTVLHHRFIFYNPKGLWLILEGRDADLPAPKFWSRIRPPATPRLVTKCNRTWAVYCLYDVQEVTTGAHICSHILHDHKLEFSLWRFLIRCFCSFAGICMRACWQICSSCYALGGAHGSHIQSADFSRVCTHQLGHSAQNGQHVRASKARVRASRRDTVAVLNPTAKGSDSTNSSSSQLLSYRTRQSSSTSSSCN